jgi:hypothetical protein
LNDKISINAKNTGFIGWYKIISNLMI